VRDPEFQCATHEYHRTGGVLFKGRREGGGKGVTNLRGEGGDLAQKQPNNGHESKQAVKTYKKKREGICILKEGKDRVIGTVEDVTK